MESQSSWKKHTIFFLASQNISLFGSMLVQYAIMWHITLTTQSGTMMMISIICGFIPTLIISPFAGVWADRLERKKVIILSDAMIAITTLAMAISFYFGFESLWQLLVVMAIRSFGNGIQTPAVSALLPQLVPNEQLTKVNGIQQSIQACVSIISPILSGALLSITPIEQIFGIDVLTAALAIGILLFLLKIPTQKRINGTIKVSYFTDLRDGIIYIHHHDFIKTLFVFCAFFFVLVSPIAFLSPLQTTRNYGPDIWRLTAIEVTFSGGMMIGGALIALWKGFANKLHTMVLSILINGVFIIAMSLIPPFWIYLACMAIIGVSMPLFNTPFTVLLQQKVDPAYLGRVFGVFSMISSSVMPLAMLFFGPLADVIKIEWMLFVTGTIMAIEGWVMSRNKKLLRAGAPDPGIQPSALQ